LKNSQFRRFAAAKSIENNQWKSPSSLRGPLGAVAIYLHYSKILVRYSLTKYAIRHTIYEHNFCFSMSDLVGKIVWVRLKMKHCRVPCQNTIVFLLVNKLGSRKLSLDNSSQEYCSTNLFKA